MQNPSSVTYHKQNSAEQPTPLAAELADTLKELRLQRQRTVGTESILARLRNDKKQVDQQLVDASIHIRNLEALVAIQKAEHDALRASHSWRVTRPLRGLKVLARELSAAFDRMKARASGLPAAASLQPPAPVQQPTEYEQWVATYATLNASQRDAIKTEVGKWVLPPTLSVIMPVYNTPVHFLRRAIDSVLCQVYPHWELCIADDASTDPQILPVLQAYTQQDPRIKLITRPANGHIAAASNSALELATGEFVCLLDHDDALTPEALYMVAKATRQHPEAHLFYSDEDKIDGDGRLLDPYFKPDWNPDLFLSYNYFNHLGCFRASLMRELGGFRVGLEGSEDYDLVLRAIHKVGADKVHHIPHVLYHWGVIPGSAAAGPEQKPYALKAAIQSVRDHLHSQKINAQVQESEPGSQALRVRYALPAVLPLVSIIIPTRDGYELLRQCIDSVYAKTTYPNFEIVVVDNGSRDPQVLNYLQNLVETKNLRVLRDERAFNYSALNNAAVRQAKGSLLCLMNNDIEVISPDWLEEMVSQALRPGIGMVGCRLWYPDDTLQHAGVVLGIGGVAGHVHHKLDRTQAGYFSRARLVQNYSAVTAACSVVRTEVFNQVDGFNEQDLAVAFNDVDLCLRIRNAGYHNLWTPFAELYHHESATRGHEDTPEKQARFAHEVGYMVSTYGDALLNDPAYNPNLALRIKDFALSYPPRITLLD
ncbi:MAG: glycosyl transferase family 2 [Burkholderiales bacterium PBB3]|nr:MAG: glycosyl transferase family 2 [Burkholderiales bacterium PBB3]